MQIGRMESDFRNPTTKVWANLENPIKSYDFSNFWLISCMPPSGGTLLQSVMSQQNNSLMELYTNFHKILFFMKMHLSSTFILWYIRTKMILHAFMIELNQLNYWYPRKNQNLWKSIYKVNGELFSCGITDSGVFRPERATYKTLHN